MNTASFQLPDRGDYVVPARFDAEAFDRERARSIEAKATIAEALDLLEKLDDEQRSAIAEDIRRRETQMAIETIEAPAAMPKEAPEPTAYDRALAESIQRRTVAARAQSDDRLAEREFMLAAVGQALGEMLETVHQRIDRLEHDNLQMRGLLHQNSLITRSLLPDPSDDLAPRTPGVLARAGSRTLTERAANRVWPSSDATPWFSEPYFNDAA